jgi:hypothetical protein
MRKMGKPGIMVDMDMRKHDLADIFRTDTERAKLRAHLLFRLDPKLHGELKIGMPGGQRFQIRGLPGIDDDHAFPVLNGPGVSRQPLAPMRIENWAKLAGRAIATASDLRLLHFDMAGLNHMNARTLRLCRLGGRGRRRISKGSRKDLRRPFL